MKYGIAYLSIEVCFTNFFVCDFIVDNFLIHINVRLKIYLSDYQLFFNFYFREDEFKS